MKASELKLYYGFRVTVALARGQLVHGILAREGRNWWIGSTQIIPRKVKSVIVYYS